MPVTEEWAERGESYPAGELLEVPSPLAAEPVDVLLNVYRLDPRAGTDGQFEERIEAGSRIVGSWLEQRTGTVVVLVAMPVGAAAG